MRARAPRRRAAHRRGAGAPLARRAPTRGRRLDLVSCQRPQVRRPEGRRRAGRPRRHVASSRSCIGGGQERERRSGTQNVAGIVAMAEAMRRHRRRADRRRSRGSRPCATGWSTGSLAGVPGVARDRAPRSARWPGSAHVCIEGVESEALLFLLDGRASARRRRRRAPAGRWSRRTCWPPWACRGSWPAARCGCRSAGPRTDADIDRGPRRGPRPADGRSPAPASRSPSDGRGRAVKVLVAMSGGVDSSVAAALLRRRRPRGRRRDDEAVGRRERHRAAARWPTSTTPAGWPSSSASTTSCSTSATTSPPTSSSRTSRPTPPGGTPNPCIECNRHLKFDRLLRAGRAARLRRRRHRPPRPRRRARRRRGWRLGPRRRPGQGPELRAPHARPGATWPGRCSRSATLTKAEVRARAAALGLRTAAKPDSQDVCFITSQRRPPGLPRRRIAVAPRPPSSTPAAAAVGEVDAVELVTVGQRKGLGWPGGGPARYVVDVDVAARHGHGRRAATTCSSRRRTPLGWRWVDGVIEDAVLAAGTPARSWSRSAPTASPDRPRWSWPTAGWSPSAGTSRSGGWRRASAVVAYDPTDELVLGGGLAA